MKFLSTWPRGKDYIWESSNWCSSPSPLNEREVRGPVDNSDGVPDSQEILETPRASSGCDNTKKLMKVKCGRCYQSMRLYSIHFSNLCFAVKDSSTDPFPGSAWLHCGFKGCKKLFVHASCNFINLPKNITGIKLDAFCRDNIR